MAQWAHKESWPHARLKSKTRAPPRGMCAPRAPARRPSNPQARHRGAPRFSPERSVDLDIRMGVGHGHRWASALPRHASAGGCGCRNEQRGARSGNGQTAWFRLETEGDRPFSVHSAPGYCGARTKGRWVPMCLLYRPKERAKEKREEGSHLWDDAG